MTDVRVPEIPAGVDRFACEIVVPVGASEDLVARNRQAVELHLDRAIRQNPGRAIVARHVWPSMTADGNDACFRGYVDLDQRVQQ